MNPPVLMSDAPRCLAVPEVFVGAPAVRVVAAPGWRDAWRGDGRDTGASGAPGAPGASGAGTSAFRRDAVTQCLDLIGVLRGYREPQDGEHWRTPAESEERLLAQVNAILGLGDEALRQVRALAIDEDLPDPGRVFAALFVLGCAAGTAWVGEMRDVFVTAVLRHPQEAAAAVEALCLAPNAAVAEAIPPLLADERWRLRAAAARVLAYRDALGEAAWRLAAQDPEPAVAQAALGTPLWRFDPGATESVLVTIAQRPDAPEALVAASLRAGGTHGFNALHGIAAKRAAQQPAQADALYAVAMHGRPEDAALLRAVLNTGQRWLAVRASGRLGSVSLMPELSGLLLESPCTPEEAYQLKVAIQSITGLRADVRGRWLQHWREHAQQYRDDRRYVEGREASPRWLLSLLCAPTASRSARQDLHASLRLAAREPLPRFNAYDFVSDQVRALHRTAAALGAVPVATITPAARTSVAAREEGVRHG